MVESKALSYSATPCELVVAFDARDPSTLFATGASFRELTLQTAQREPLGHYLPRGALRQPSASCEAKSELAAVDILLGEALLRGGN